MFILSSIQKYFSFDVEYLPDRDESKMRITEDNINQVYKISKSIYENQMDFNIGLSILEKEMNRRSAEIYIDDFIKMMNGELFKRSISSLAAKIFIERIRDDFGKKYSKKALKSLEANLNYQKECGMGKNSKLYSVLDEQKKKEGII